MNQTFCQKKDWMRAICGKAVDSKSLPAGATAPTYRRLLMNTIAMSFFAAWWGASGGSSAAHAQQLNAAPASIAQSRPELLPPADLDPNIRPQPALPAEPLPQLPPIEELLGEPAPSITPESASPSTEAAFVIEGITLEGNTVFSNEDFAALFAQYIGQPITFNDLLTLRSQVTQRYVDAGYLTSGAFIPPQTLTDGIVTIQVIEGEIEEIEIVGTHRLRPEYIRSRLGLAAQPPINADELLEGLQRLQIDPLIETVSADLQAGVRPGTSILRVEVTEADSFDVTVSLDNNRSPNVGSFRRQIELSEGNLTGVGERTYVSYSNTEGSNSLDVGYSVPVSPHNTRVSFNAGISNSRIINGTASVLDASSDAFYADIGVTHPLIETPTQTLELGLTLSHKENQIRVGLTEIGPLALSPGADENGRTRTTALRFSQSWTQRSQQQVLAARSQFNLGLNILNSNISDEPGVPDSEFFSWRGQGQWVRLLGEDSLFFLRTDVQLASDRLLSSEQFSLGGQQSVRGYRQDALLRDNGALLSAEARLPLVRFADDSLVQITPFFDVGAAWNQQDSPPGNNVLAGTGFGLLWQQGDNLSARIDWGIPLVDIDSVTDSLQDSGIYFSLDYTLF